MPRKPVFALGTDVPVGKTKGEIETLLQRHGAGQVMLGSDRSAGVGIVGFTLQGRQYRIVLRARDAGRAKPEQLEREQWRALLLVLKGKLELVARGDATAQQEFLAHLVLPDGQTLGDAVEPLVEEAYRSGVQPMLGQFIRPRELGPG